MSDELPQSAVTAAARELETALRTVSWDTWDDLARKVLAAAQAAGLTGATAAQAAADERERIRQLAIEHNALVFVYNASQITGEPGWYTPHPFADLLAGTADGAHTPGGTT